MLLIECVQTYIQLMHVLSQFLHSSFDQVQLVSSDGRSGNFSSPLTMECSGSVPLVKSLMTIVMCVVMAMLVCT